MQKTKTSKPEKNYIAEDPQKHFIKFFNDLCYGQTPWKVFQDFCEMSAISLRQPFYQNEKAEKRYMQIITSYPEKKRVRFSQMLACVVLGLERESHDFMGKVFHELEMHNKNMGQFFTPYSMSQLLAQLLMNKDVIDSSIKQQGYMTMSEPTCGAGGMVIACMEAFQEAGYNPQTQLFVVAQDLDFTAVNMTYIQMSLLGIPGQVIWGNTLMVECKQFWNTPMCFINNWSQRIKTASMLKSIRKVLQIESKPAGAIVQDSSIVKKDPYAEWEILPVEPDVIIEESGQLLFNF